MSKKKYNPEIVSHPRASRRSVYQTLSGPDMFNILSEGGASAAEIMSILNGKYGKGLSSQLNGCTNMCVPGATAGLSVRV